jgi:hypothetical protein
MKLYSKIKENCKHRGDVNITTVKTISSIKYKLHGSGLPRPVDIFRIVYNPIKMVKKFHLHCVKMFYNGKITMFRSCVSSLLTGINESYKWFTCNKVPVDVIFKYAQRGSTLILNKNERDVICKFISNNDRWGKMLNEFNIKPEEIFNTVNYNHPFFRPDIYDTGIRKNLKVMSLNKNNIFCNVLKQQNNKQIFNNLEVLTHDYNRVYPPNFNIIICLMLNYNFNKLSKVEDKNTTILEDYEILEELSDLD